MKKNLCMHLLLVGITIIIIIKVMLIVFNTEIIMDEDTSVSIRFQLREIFQN